MVAFLMAIKKIDRLAAKDGPTDEPELRFVRRPLRRYEALLKMVIAEGVVRITLANESDSLRARYIQALKKEKTKDSLHRHQGELRFSWVGNKLTIRFIR